MLSFGALNASCSEDSNFIIFHEVRQEEQESEALSLYNEAQQFLKEKSLQKAEERFREVLQSELIEQAGEQLEEKEVIVDNPALYLKYNTYKALATMKEISEESEKALDYYLEMAVIDDSDVTLWWNISQLAEDTFNIRLQRYAYEKGLLCSPNHWPCLDMLISTLYILGDYAACLDMIDKSLKRNKSYTKGFAFRDQIFKEEPHFKKDCVKLMDLFSEDESKDEMQYQKFIEDALIVRGKRSLLAKTDEKILRERLPKPLLFYSWLNLGECLISLYNMLTNPANNKSLACMIDLSKYYRNEEQQGALIVPSPDVLLKKYFKSTAKDVEGKNLKRKKLIMSSSQESCESQPKRRSNRVKCAKRKDMDINWCEVIYAFLPSVLKPTDVTTDNGDSQDNVSDTNTDSTLSNERSIEDLKKEARDVSDFINRNMQNSTCIDLFKEYLFAVESFSKREWQPCLSPIAIKIFEKYCKHTCWPCVFNDENDMNYMGKLGKMILLVLELEIEKFTLKKDTYIALTPTMSPLIGHFVQNRPLKEELHKFLSDLHYLSMMGAQNSQLLNKDKEFKIRFYWLHGRYCMMQNEINCAANSFSNCLHFLMENAWRMSEVHIKHCSIENTINEGTIIKKLECMQQCQSLEELQEMFDMEKYSEVIDELKSLFEEEMLDQHNVHLERPLQLFLLQSSYLKTKQLKQSIHCILLGLNESLQNGTIRDHWKLRLNQMLSVFNLSLTDTAFQTDFISQKELSTFISLLVKIIEISMDNEPFESEFATTLPWVLLAQLCKMQPSSNVDKSDGNRNCEVINFLREAHKYIGRKHWCCHDSGLFLMFYIEEIKAELNKNESAFSKDVLFKDMEQCLYCLYGDLCKKSKTKLFEDHYDKPIELTWSNANLLYSFYKPTELPQLDLKTNTIPLEVQNAFRRIVSVVPLKEVEVISLETVQQYVDGGIQLPKAGSNEKHGNPMADIFYYLGDYYFKNKEFSKALKFYMHDVSINHNRFQSWAAMALTRGSRLEEKINQCDLRSDGIIKKYITSTLRCYEKAVQLNNRKCIILEEYGQTTYMLNSYARKRLQEDNQCKKQDQLAVEFYTSLKIDMLLLSTKCFREALNVALTQTEGELWVHYYMLGKTAERQTKDVGDYLDYYQKSLEELYKNGARLNKKIPFHGAPEYTIEGIEIFYRIHCSILKVLLHSNAVNYDVLEMHIEKVANQKICREAFCCDKTTTSNENVGDGEVVSVLNGMLENVCKPLETTADTPVNGCLLNERDEQMKIVSILLKDIVNMVLAKDTADVKHSTKKLKFLSKQGLPRQFSDQAEKSRYKSIADKCLEALSFCLQRFPEHYKSQSCMAHFLLASPICQNLDWSNALLLGGPGQFPLSLPSHGLFSSKKKTNFFQYFWRIPVNEIDRPGSFLKHTSNAVKLLLDVLCLLKDTSTLLQVAIFLHKTPDKDRKYLHDDDRAYFAIKAFDFLIDVIQSLLSEVKTPRERNSLLLKTYDAYKHAQKMQVSLQIAEECLVECYTTVYPERSAFRESKSLVEEAAKTCQQMKPIS